MKELISRTQRIVNENIHGVIFGAIASILLIFIRNITDETLIFLLTLISVIAGIIITYYFQVPKKLLSKNAVFIILGMVIALSVFGVYTETFASTPTTIFGKFTKFIFGKVIGVTLFSSLLMGVNIFLGIIAFVLGLFILGVPVGNLINTLSDNFIWVLVAIVLVAVLSLAYKGKK